MAPCSEKPRLKITSYDQQVINNQNRCVQEGKGYWLGFRALLLSSAVGAADTADAPALLSVLLLLLLLSPLLFIS